MFQAHQFRDICQTLICLFLGIAKIFRRYHQLFTHCGTENLMVWVLEHIAAPARHFRHRLPGRVLSHQVHLALGGAQQAVEMAHQRGFSAAVLPYNRYDVPLVDIKIYPLQGPDIAARVNMHQFFHADYCLCHNSHTSLAQRGKQRHSLIQRDGQGGHFAQLPAQRKRGVRHLRQAHKMAVHVLFVGKHLVWVVICHKFAFMQHQYLIHSFSYFFDVVDDW